MKNPLQSFLLVMLMSLTACAQQTPVSAPSENQKKQTPDMDKPGLEIATLAGGCFWCVEAVYQDLKGVYKVESGYSGGTTVNPTYREIGSGITGHAEAVQIHFDPKEISFEEILEVFWSTHDPTTLNRQGHDVGTQYRSAIFYHTDEQKVIAEKSIREVATTIWDDPIVTEVAPVKNFYVAESYHQDYYSLNANQPYCRAVITPKMAKFREKFADKLKPEAEGKKQ
ncbi:MAG: peptide-methionine (S)-S-oxide reductase MsrA [Saprospiraceae bacterium]|nr:peptide-methionine (S)-S-oxide reductase MsrA [Saprospiraceae bacterium]